MNDRSIAIVTIVLMARFVFLRRPSILVLSQLSGHSILVLAFCGKTVESFQDDLIVDR